VVERTWLNEEDVPGELESKSKEHHALGEIDWEPETIPEGAKMTSVDDDLFQQFEPRGTVGQILLRQFVGLLRDGRLRPGDKLPPERELATMLGISRPSVRQALSALGLIGIIESRQGSGTYVAENLNRLPLEPFIYRLLLNQGSFDELMEVRELIEPAVTGLAARRATQDGLDGIASAFGRYEAAISGQDGVDVEAESGMEFHRALAAAAGNSTLVALLEGLRDLIGAAGRLLGSEERGASLAAHREIYEAVLDRNGPRAEQLMRDHLDDVSKRLRTAKNPQHGLAAPSPSSTT
jgi:GntR family transcriptional repressor for pyruvate dehydrogenase complex